MTRNFSRIVCLALVTLALAACLKTTPTPTPTASLEAEETATAIPSTATPTPKPTSTPTRTATPTATATPIPGTATYHNADEGFSISYPKDWVESEPGGLTPILIITAPGQLPQAYIYILPLAQPQTSAEASKDLLESIRAELSNLTVVSEGNTTVGDQEAYQVVTTFTQDSIKGKMKLVSVVKGSRLFSIQAFSTESNFDRRIDDINFILFSLRLTEPAPFGIPRNQALTLVSSGPITLDPAVAQETGSHQFILHIFSGLVTLDRNLKVVPDLAEWTVSSDGTVYTFRLRRGAKLHSGREVTAQDFKYSWERATDRTLGSQTARTYLGDIVGVVDKLEGRATEIRGVKVLDSYTLQVTIDAPKVYFLSKLTYPVAYVVNSENVKAGGTEWWKNPDGTGPFKLKEWKKDDLLVLERNASYYGQSIQLPYAVFRLFAGVPARMYETGEVDAAFVGAGDLERLQDPTNPLSKELSVFPELSVGYIGFNAEKPPFDNPLVRRAFAMAVDKDKLIEVVLQNAYYKAGGFLPPGMPGFNTSLKGLPYDPAGAKSLLAQAGYADPSKLLAIVLSEAGTGDISPIYGAIIQMWKDNLGVQVSVNQVNPDEYFYRLRENKGNLFEFGWVADYPDPEDFLDVLFHTGAENNVGGYSNKQIDALLEQARTEKDVAKRMALYQQAEQLLVDDASAIPLWFGISPVLVKPYVKGFYITPQSFIDLKGISLGER